MNSFLFSFFVPIIGTVQSSSIHYEASVRPCVRRVEARAAGTEVRHGAQRVARSHAREKKITAGGGSKRMEKKAGKKYFGGSEKRGRERKRKHNQQKDCVCTVETKKCTHNHIIVFFLFLWSRRSCNLKFFKPLSQEKRIECKGKKIVNDD